MNDTRIYMEETATSQAKKYINKALLITIIMQS